jgi:hypothetical protein
MGSGGDAYWLTNLIVSNIVNSCLYKNDFPIFKVIDISIGGYPHQPLQSKMTHPITIAHLFACFAMTGVIWLIQLVHYPMFAYIDSTKFAAAHAMHSAAITLIVFPLMGLELLTSFYLVGAGDAPGGRGWMVLNLGGVLLLWGSTAFLFIPLHNILTIGGYNLEAIQRLVMFNWIRTLIWSVRAGAWVVWLMGR